VYRAASPKSSFATLRTHARDSADLLTH